MGGEGAWFTWGPGILILGQVRRRAIGDAEAVSDRMSSVLMYNSVKYLRGIIGRTRRFQRRELSAEIQRLEFDLGLGQPSGCEQEESALCGS